MEQIIKEKNSLIERANHLLNEQPASTEEIIRIMNILNYLKGKLSETAQNTWTPGKSQDLSVKDTAQNTGIPGKIEVHNFVEDDVINRDDLHKIKFINQQIKFDEGYNRALEDVKKKVTLDVGFLPLGIKNRLDHLKKGKEE